MNKNFREFNKRATRLAGIKESKKPMRRRRLNENIEITSQSDLLPIAKQLQQKLKKAVKKNQKALDDYSNKITNSLDVYFNIQEVNNRFLKVFKRYETCIRELNDLDKMYDVYGGDLESGGNYVSSMPEKILKNIADFESELEKI